MFNLSTIYLLNFPSVIFDSVLEHILWIDRVLKQPINHLILIDQSGVGKKILYWFVAWMNNLTLFQKKLTDSFKGNEHTSLKNTAKNFMNKEGKGIEQRDTEEEIYKNFIKVVVFTMNL